MSTHPLPADHPAHILGTANDDDEYAYLNVDVSGSGRPGGPPGRSLMHWHAALSVQRHSETPLNQPVATMGMTVVNPDNGNPLEDLDSLDQDAYELGAALWTGNGEVKAAFEAVTDTFGGPVLLIDSYIVEPSWRGTAVTPLMALRVLEVFAHTGVTAAALKAWPMTASLSDPSRFRAAAKISKMWSRVGFEHLGADTNVMAMPLNPGAIRTAMKSLAQLDPVLREVAGDES